MIVVTGANGFIGSWMIEKLNAENFNDILAVDEFRNKKPHNYLLDLHFSKMLHLENLEEWLNQANDQVEFVVHLGAITDTTLEDEALFAKFNTNYTKMLWKICAMKQIPFIYASSAATYGNGAYGFKVDYDNIKNLRPLNHYAKSKHSFDIWALDQIEKPYYWAGLKFFNVYGPKREGHKGKMASMAYQIEEQIKETGKVKLFKSYKSGIKHGEQKRDFIHVSEVVNEIYNLMQDRSNSGIRNIGSGKAKSFNELTTEVAKSLNQTLNIEYIDMPQSLRENYQYFTLAE
ncbi:MAG: ADP-glyceromanno-heptose 6-epimerase [Cyclobacteriaceae bacterium]